MIKTLASSILLTGCVLDVSVGNGGPSNSRTEVALVPVTTSNDVDVLFVIDDSPGALALQPSLQRSFPAFLSMLAGPTGLPNLHIGVVSTDLGTKGAEDATNGPSLGSGPGSCSGVGRGASLQNSGTLVAGTFIEDLDAGSTRTKNYSGALADAFTSISSLGASGCGFEQPLEAARRALVNNAANAGFLRAQARLAVIVVTDEDDCSIAHNTLFTQDTATLGPLQSFRCTRFGVTCDDGGKTTDDMNKPGVKSKCHAESSSPYMIDVAASAHAIQSVKDDQRNVLFGAIAGVSSSIEVAMQVPPGGGSPIPTLQPECTWPSIVPEKTIQPAIRIIDHAYAYPRHHVQMACGDDLTAPAIGLASAIRSMLGDPCLTRAIATPTDCEAWDTRADGSRTPLPACSQQSGACYRFVQDASCSASGLRLEVVRASPPPTDTMVSLRCKL